MLSTLSPSRILAEIITRNECGDSGFIEKVNSILNPEPFPEDHFLFVDVNMHIIYSRNGICICTYSSHKNIIRDPSLNQHLSENLMWVLKRRMTKCNGQIKIIDSARCYDVTNINESVAEYINHVRMIPKKVWKNEKTESSLFSWLSK